MPLENDKYGNFFFSILKFRKKVVCLACFGHVLILEPEPFFFLSIIIIIFFFIMDLFLICLTHQIPNALVFQTCYDGGDPDKRGKQILF